MKITRIVLSSDNKVFKSEDFTGMHPTLKKELLDTFKSLDSHHKLLQWVPFGPDKVIAQQLRTSPPKNQLLTTYGSAGGVAEGMSFNPRYWSSVSRINKVFVDNHNLNLLHCQTLKDVLSHEYGHILSRNFDTTHKEGSRTICTKRNGQDAQSQVYDLLRDLAPKLGREWVEKYYGTYGSKDHKEIFAETYRMILQGTLPKELVKVKDILKQNGIRIPK